MMKMGAMSSNLLIDVDLPIFQFCYAMGGMATVLLGSHGSGRHAGQ
ncbi:MAG: hypothetical protein AAGD96_17960 [Chloroflexota bacterium]